MILCKCGCGNPTTWNRWKKRWNQYIHGHHKPWLGKQHSEATKKKISAAKIGRNYGLIGKNSPSWKDGRTKAGGGYIFIYCPEHPFADINKRVKEERLIIERILGRYLLKTEIVHHKNRIKDDNRAENLQVVSSVSEHMDIHKSFKGHKHTKEAKRKMSEAHKRRKEIKRRAN